MKIEVPFVNTLSSRILFRDTAGTCGSENIHNVVQLNTNKKNYLPTAYPTFKPRIKRFSSERIRAIARNPNIDPQSIIFYSKMTYIITLEHNNFKNYQ